MSDDRLEYEEARERVIKRMKKRQEFYIHLAVYVGVNLFLWFIGLLTGSLEFPWPLIVMFGWGIGLFAHGVETYFQSSPQIEERREQAIQRELERERARKAGDVVFEKRKRTARLAEDGELVYDDEAEEEQPRNVSRRNP
jgi:hypothetical protein